MTCAQSESSLKLIRMYLKKSVNSISPNGDPAFVKKVETDLQKA